MRNQTQERKGKTPEARSAGEKKKKGGRTPYIPREKYFEALELYSSPDIDGKPVDLLTACNITGISIAHLRDVCDSDKELEAARTRARSARAELMRIRRDNLLEEMIEGKKDVKAVDTYVKRMDWMLERDSRKDYGSSHDVNMNISQMPDFSRLSETALNELRALIDGGGYLPNQG